jgi:proline iminopeptidase
MPAAATELAAMKTAPMEAAGMEAPDVDVQVGTAKMKARARTATGAERARLWKKVLEFWPPYADYQKKTEREIPVVVLDPMR